MRIPNGLYSGGKLVSVCRHGARAGVPSSALATRNKVRTAGFKNPHNHPAFAPALHLRQRQGLRPAERNQQREKPGSGMLVH